MAVVMGLIFGLGYGAYQAVDWGRWPSDVLPSESDYAKDMGIWHVLIHIAAGIGWVPIGGVLLDDFSAYWPPEC